MVSSVKRGFLSSRGFTFTTYCPPFSVSQISLLSRALLRTGTDGSKLTRGWSLPYLLLLPITAAKKVEMTLERKSFLSRKLDPLQQHRGTRTLSEIGPRPPRSNNEESTLAIHLSKAWVKNSGIEQKKKTLDSFILMEVHA